MSKINIIHKRLIIATVVMILLLSGAIWYLGVITDPIFREWDTTEEFCKDVLGKRVLIADDTLTIINFSVFNETLTLSDGKTIDLEYIRKEGNLID